MKRFVVTENEVERRAALRQYDIFDMPHDIAFEHVTALAARLLKVPIAVVGLIDDDQVCFKSHFGIPFPELTHHQELSALAIHSDAPWFVADARIDTRTHANPLVTGEFGLRFYAAAPMTTCEGYHFGTLSVIDKKPRHSGAADIVLLQQLAEIIMDEMELHLAGRRSGRLEGDPTRLTACRGFSKKITERTQREENLRRFRAAMDATADAIFLVDRASMRFVDFNETFCRILGYSRRELLELGPEDIEIGAPDQLRQLYDNIIAGLNEHDLTEVRIRAKNGTEFPMEIHRRTLRSGDGWIMVIVARDITERRQAQEALAQSHAVLRQLSIALQTVREEERRRIARELHDDLGQLLAALRMDLTMLQNPGRNEPSYQVTAHMDQLIALSVNLVRRIAKDLRPKALDEGGLYFALQSLLKEYVVRHGIACEFRAQESELALDDTRSTAIFRIIQESLTNISQHAQAKNVIVEMTRRDSNFSINIKDDGRGITDADMQKKHSFGLVGMRERVHELRGRIDISGFAGQGTSIRITLPVPA